MDDLTLASLNALVSEALTVYTALVNAGLTPSDAHRKTVIDMARKAEELDIAHGAMLEGAKRTIANIPNMLQSLCAEHWPAGVTDVRLHHFVGKLKKSLAENLVINLF